MNLSLQDHDGGNHETPPKSTLTDSPFPILPRHGDDPERKTPVPDGSPWGDDSQHPRGCREIRSNAEMRKLLDKKIVAQNGECAICSVRSTDYTDIVPDQINPRSRGGTTIRETFRLSAGGATEKRGRAEGDAGAAGYRRRQLPTKSLSFGHCTALNDRADS